MTASAKARGPADRAKSGAVSGVFLDVRSANRIMAGYSPGTVRVVLKLAYNKMVPGVNNVVILDECANLLAFPGVAATKARLHIGTREIPRRTVTRPA